MSHEISAAIGETVERLGATATAEQVVEELEATFSPTDLREFAEQFGFNGHKEAIIAILKDSGYIS